MDTLIGGIALALAVIAFIGAGSNCREIEALNKRYDVLEKRVLVLETKMDFHEGR